MYIVIVTNEVMLLIYLGHVQTGMLQCNIQPFIIDVYMYITNQ